MIIAALAGVVAATSAFAQTSAPAAGTQASQLAAATRVAANDTTPRLRPADGLRLIGNRSMKSRVPRYTTSSFRRSRTISLRS